METTFTLSGIAGRPSLFGETISREDGFDKLGDANLKGHVQITFIDKFGEPEYIDLSRLSRSPANVTPNVGLVLTVEGCSRNSLRRFAKRSSIQTGGCG